MTLWMAVVYGIIQGLTEFLPVSSSGHLALLPFIYEFKDPGIFFDLAMHVGTALAVGIYFHHDVRRIAKNSFLFFIPGKSCDNFTKNFIIATFFTGFFGLILKSTAETYGRNEVFIAFNLAFFGILLFISDRIGKTNKNMEGFRASSSIVIGLSQVLSIFPGVSRSGITITAARFLGLSKEDASSFSFLLSLPLIFAAFLLKSYNLIGNPQDAQFEVLNCAIGVLVSFLVGLATIHFFMKLIKRIQFSYFLIYRLILSALVFYLLN
ncbi:undecaprenyl-diphosphate phosphatase [Halobacteriovorax sp. RT-2-4]|uniref:undecaprenyl-diphosphate phosphatase n=1 Tax=unclassified Halobacteriovorax TaxID=2639665 RepID=UPI0039994D8B